MTTRYVGKGGSNGNSGLTWALRKLTLNGVEDTPVVAGDDIYVGPGAYRETLVCDVTGTAGNPITYIGDITGENTDGVGGIVRITSSDDDLTADRWASIDAQDMNYRTFRGFFMDFTLNNIITAHNCDNWIIEDCVLSCDATATIILVDEGGTDWTIRRCYFPFGRFKGINFTAVSDVDDIGHLVENCIFINVQDPIRMENVGDGTIRNCFFAGASSVGIRVVISQTPAHPWNVNNCIFMRNSVALQAATSGDIVENYNTFFANLTDRTLVSTGGQSNTYNPGLLPPTLLDGIKFPTDGFSWSLSEWSALARIAGTGEATEDFFGIVRPTVSAKKSWSAIQYKPGKRDAAEKRSGLASVKLDDAGDHVMLLPTDGTEITISCYVKREANYAGTAPRMIIRQAGQSDDITTDAGGTGSWNQLTTTLTPAADPSWVAVILRSLNTATSGSYAVNFDDLEQT